MLHQPLTRPMYCMVGLTLLVACKGDLPPVEFPPGWLVEISGPDFEATHQEYETSSRVALTGPDCHDAQFLNGLGMTADGEEYAFNFALSSNGMRNTQRSVSAPLTHAYTEYYGTVTTIIDAIDLVAFRIDDIERCPQSDESNCVPMDGAVEVRLHSPVTATAVGRPSDVYEDPVTGEPLCSTR